MSEKALEYLKAQDVEAFNNWRTDAPEAALDLSGQDLTNLTLDGALLVGANLEGADLSHSSLVGVVFAGGSVKGAKFFNADLTQASFGPPELIEASLATSPLGSKMMYGADCSGANFEQALITGAQFRETNCAGADFTMANHAEANFKNANLEGAVMPEEGSTSEERAWGALQGLGEEQKRAYIQSLFAIACVDGDFDESEQAFLFMVAQKMEMSPDEFEACIPAGSFSLDDVNIDPPDNDEIRIQWLRNLILMVAADGVLAPTEYQTCLLFAEKLGFQPQVIDQVLSNLQR